MTRVRYLLPVLLCTSAVAGCGQKPQESQDANAEYPAEAPSDAVEAMPAPAADEAAVPEYGTSTDAAADAAADAGAAPNQARENEGKASADD